MAEVSRITPMVETKLESLRRAFNELPPEHDDVVKHLDAATRKAESAWRELDISPGRKLYRDIEQRLAQMVSVEHPVKRRAACELVARALARKYCVQYDTMQTAKVIRAVERFGSALVLDAACDLCDEPRDARVRDVFCVLHGRSRSRYEATR